MRRTITVTFEVENSGDEIAVREFQDGSKAFSHVDTLIHAARKILEGLNTKFPCQENKDAIGHLIAAIGCLEARTANRLARNVEGESKT